MLITLVNKVIMHFITDEHQIMRLAEISKLLQFVRRPNPATWIMRRAK